MKTCYRVLVLIVFQLVVILLLLVAACVEVLLFANMLSWSVLGILGVPFVPTPRNILPKVADALQIRTGDVVYELGSGDGRFLIYAGKRCPGARFVGIERDPCILSLARLRLWWSGLQNVEFRRGNLFDTDLSPASKVYCYLLPSMMEKLLPICRAQLRAARLASRAFPFAHQEALEVVTLSERPGNHGQHLLYLYEFTK